MNRVISAIYIIISLGVIIESLDAWKLESALSNSQKRTEKRRYKRQDEQPEAYQLPVPSSLSSCFDSSDLNPNCPSNAAPVLNAVFLHHQANDLRNQNLWTNSDTSMSALQDGSMCFEKTHLLTANAFSALELGHMTFPQFAPFNVFPLKRLDYSALAKYNYINTVGQTSLLTGLGMQAAILGHIAAPELQSLNLYPLQPSSLSLNVLIQGGYLTNDCIPTALGLFALHTRYLSSDTLSSLGCSMNDYSQASIPQLQVAKYVYGTSNLLTPVALAAIRTGYISRERFQSLGIYPIRSSRQPQSDEFDDQEQTTQTSISDLMHVGYLHADKCLTSAGYDAYEHHYFNKDYFLGLNLWPYPGPPSLTSFVTAGYASYSGHLTTLGYSLLHAQYFSIDYLTKIGLHYHSDYHIFHHALSFGGYFHSLYSTVHRERQASSIISSTGITATPTAPSDTVTPTDTTSTTPVVVADDTATDAT